MQMYSLAMKRRRAEETLDRNARVLEATAVERVSVDGEMLVRHGQIGADHRIEDHVALLGPVVDWAKERIISALCFGASVVFDHGTPAATGELAIRAGIEKCHAGMASPGQWIASSQRLLDLSGEINPVTLRTAFAGLDPARARCCSTRRTAP